ncbi:cytoskeleton protein RodZ [Vibrio neptunius]|uniref:Cytoskeleton protein RodZ n=1 Tax=Vibrio neptunius TaxID=170651 RepID=A0ABS3A3G3_9VIBR|nr:cytoskeleton protein RodZ [Vibrio neptunius]MBN3493914.1 cytoskeleton protein RodZ [Vibrio neptunius]MBN3516410.1 cytoskeleton protein RodZ [Vibrio neptunius]MBN3550618.1 cytoskeleton protein RodZ [Vibrio neptunius]MBN3573822.1 cytoskeleton protein RodZ [Vibrio neptunius]MBN3578749.1 cytoskeleton protein RodZ [Vibrio neptunius]
MSAEQQTKTPVEEDNNIERIEAGTLLKQKREELGLTQQQVADRLRLRRSIIENIESNQFESEQVATFTRGYLRSYARVVGIKESVVLCALDDCGEAQYEEHEMQSFSQKTNKEKHDSRIMTLTWGIFAIIVGISSVWWWQNQENSVVELTAVTEQEKKIEQELAENSELDFTAVEPSLINDSVETKPVVEQPLEEVTTPVQVGVSEPDSEVVEPSIETVQQVNEPVKAETVSREAADPVAAVEPNQQENNLVETSPPVIVANLLEMSFIDDCWIQVKDATGKTLATGIKKAGQDLQVSGERPYKVILGAPENVSMTLASEPVDLSGYTSGKVARFNLP